MDLNTELQEAAVSLRELQRRTGISLGTLSATAKGERELSTGERTLVAVALDLAPETPAEAADADSKLDTYPSAPTDPEARRAYFKRRSELMAERGVPVPETAIFGKGVAGSGNSRA
jgi:hypothetical protein